MTALIKQIELPWPSSDLTPHAKGGWWKKATATAKARGDAKLVALEAPAIECEPRAVIYVEYWPKAYRGDVQNMHGRMKAYIDGIADAMGCDDKQFEVHFPAKWAGKDPKGKVVFRVMRPAVVEIPLRGIIT